MVDPPDCVKVLVIESELVIKNFETAIINVVRQYNWAPESIGALFVDEVDYLGLFFWNNDAEKINAELKEKPKT